MEFDPEQNKVEWEADGPRYWAFIVVWDFMDDAVYPRYKRGWYAT